MATQINRNAPETRTTKMMRLARRIALFLGRQARRPVLYTSGSLRRDASFRRGFAVAMAWVAIIALLWQGGGWVVEVMEDAVDEFLADRAAEEEIEAAEEAGKPPPKPETPAYVARVRAARAAIRGFNQDVLPHVLDEYNHYVRSPRWRERARSCFEQIEQFREAERLTLYPAELLAGIALHESAGCNMGAKDRAGGRGWMQLTHISQVRHVRPAAQMLHLPIAEVRYHRDPEHNLLVGVMVLDDYERIMGSRERGLLAYNMGPGGVRRAMKKYGWREGDPKPTVTELRPFLRDDPRMRPRVYVPKVLATAVMMNRVANNQPLSVLQRLEPQDVPGWNPRDDGASWSP